MHMNLSMNHGRRNICSSNDRHVQKTCKFKCVSIQFNIYWTHCWIEKWKDKRMHISMFLLLVLIEPVY